MAAHFHKITVREIRKETPDCVSIVFAIPPELRESFRYYAGQSLTIRAYQNNQELRRSYSLCSSPLEPEWRIAVKKVPGGLFSTYANEALSPGDSLEVLPPVGNFYTLPGPENKKNYVAFAAGSGITPILSMLKTILATEPLSSFTLIYGNRDSRSILFKEDLEALKNRYLQRLSLHYIFSREKTEAAINYGRIDEQKCNQLFDRLISPDADAFFICGPGDMIFRTRDFLLSKRIREEKIHFELFTTSPREPALSQGAGEGSPSGALSRITIIHDGISSEFDLGFGDESILDASIRQGIDLPYSCKGGVCCTCRARLKAGEVVMDANYALESRELAAGFILTCQSHPKTGRVIIDFDDR